MTADPIIRGFKVQAREDKASMRAVDPGSLKAMCDRDDGGNIVPNTANAITLVAHDPELAGLLGFNEFEGEHQILHAAPACGIVVSDDPFPRAWGDGDVARILAYLQRAHARRFRKADVLDAMLVVAGGHRFHPVRAYLDGLRWDGVKRLDTWLVSALGTADSPYVRAVGAKSLVAAVRRIRRPGVKYDCMPILEGGQGIGKSRLLRRLFGEGCFTDTIYHDLKNKDASGNLVGVWGVEFAEIEHLVRGEVETIKGFLSRPVERYRPPYAKGNQRFPRQCVFFGTTNAEEYLRDTTGNRRFWPVACSQTNEPWVAENRDQLWAEAAQREATHETIWLEAENLADARREQATRLEHDVWADRVAVYVAQKMKVSVPELLEGPCKVPVERHDKRLQMRVAGILKAMRWRKDRESTARYWVPPEPGEED